MFGSQCEVPSYEGIRVEAYVRYGLLDTTDPFDYKTYKAIYHEVLRDLFSITKQNMHQAFSLIILIQYYLI